MRWKRINPRGRFNLTESIEIDEDVECVFAHWNRCEDFARFMDNVRRTKRIDEHRVIWEVDVAGHQIIWEAQLIESIPGKLLRWKSSSGAEHSGEARFEELTDSRTRLTVEIEYRPRGILESLGARLGLADSHVRRDLERFRDFVENLPIDEFTSSINEGARNEIDQLDRCDLPGYDRRRGG